MGGGNNGQNKIKLSKVVGTFSLKGSLLYRNGSKKTKNAVKKKYPYETFM